MPSPWVQRAIQARHSGHKAAKPAEATLGDRVPADNVPLARTDEWGACNVPSCPSFKSLAGREHDVLAHREQDDRHEVWLSWDAEREEVEGWLRQTGQVPE